MSSPIIHFDYEFSPYGQKTKLLLTAAGVQYKRCDQPAVLPRKDLEALGITYRRIPVLSVGKDVYCDSSLIFDVVVNQLAKDKVPTSPADKAWECYGYETFMAVLTLIPIDVLTPDFVKDRETIFPILARPDYKDLKPSGIAELQSRLSFLENEVLTTGTYIGGGKLSVADMHVIWGIRWVMNDLGVKNEKGLGKDAFPKVWKLIESLPEAKPETLSSEDAIKTIKGADVSAKDVGVQEGDPLGISSGTPVTIESMDSKPGSHPQAGKLVGATKKEVVLEVDDGIHLHFPREGYVVREASI